MVSSCVSSKKAKDSNNREEKLFGDFFLPPSLPPCFPFLASPPRSLGAHDCPGGVHVFRVELGTVMMDEYGEHPEVVHVGTTALAGAASFERGLSPEMASIVQALSIGAYEDFVQLLLSSYSLYLRYEDFIRLLLSS